MKMSALTSEAASRTSTTGINAKAWWSDMLERWLERIDRGTMAISFGEYAQQRARLQFIELPLLDLPAFQVRDGPIYGFAQKNKRKTSNWTRKERKQGVRVHARRG